jgi:hypothetical protein
MRTFLTTLAAASVLAAGLLGNRADAFTLAAPSTLSVAATRAAAVQQVVSVCGTNGCAPVQTKRVRHYKPGGTAPGQHI